MDPHIGSKNGAALDLLDSQIVALLQEDGRRSNTDIARQLSVNEATVRKRIDRLVEDKTIRISAWADPLKLGYQTYANIEILVHPPYLEQAAAAIAQFPEIFFLGICTGKFDILAVGLFVSNDHMYEFLSRRLANVRGIDRVSTSHIIRTLKRDFPRSHSHGLEHSADGDATKPMAARPKHQPGRITKSRSAAGLKKRKL